jgi:hypothetical protein
MYMVYVHVVKTLFLSLHSPPTKGVPFSRMDYKLGEARKHAEEVGALNAEFHQRVSRIIRDSLKNEPREYHRNTMEKFNWACNFIMLRKATIIYHGVRPWRGEKRCGRSGLLKCRISQTSLKGTTLLLTGCTVHSWCCKNRKNLVPNAFLSLRTRESLILNCIQHYVNREENSDRMRYRNSQFQQPTTLVPYYLFVPSARMDTDVNILLIILSVCHPH